MVRTAGGSGAPSLSDISEDLIPDIDNLRKIGSNLKRWAALYAVLIFTTAVTIGTIVIQQLGPGWLYINASTYMNGSLNVSGNISASWINASLDCSNVENAASDLCTLTDTNGTPENINHSLNVSGNVTAGLFVGNLSCTYITGSNVNLCNLNLQNLTINISNISAWLAAGNGIVLRMNSTKILINVSANTTEFTFTSNGQLKLRNPFEDHFLNDTGDSVKAANSLYNWNESNLTKIKEADITLLCARNNIIKNYSANINGMVPDGNAFYDLGQWMPLASVAGNRSYPYSHAFRYGYLDDMFVLRGNTSNTSLYQFANSMDSNNSPRVNITPVSVLAASDNTLPGYVLNAEKQTMLYNTEPQGGMVLSDFPRAALMYRYFYPVTFARPFDTTEYTDIAGSCNFNVTPAMIWLITGGMVMEWHEFVTTTGFVGHCDVVIPLVGGVPQEPEAAILYSWHAVEREDDHTAAVIQHVSQYDDQLACTG